MGFRASAGFVAFVVKSLVLVRWSERVAIAIDVFSPFLSRSFLERFSGSICQQGDHAGCTESRRWGIIKRLIIIPVFWIAVDALPLCLIPADAPCAMAAGYCYWYNNAGVVGAKVGAFKGKHSSHRASNYGRNLAYTELIQYNLVRTIGRLDFMQQECLWYSILNIISYCLKRKLWPISLQTQISLETSD